MQSKHSVKHNANESNLYADDCTPIDVILGYLMTRRSLMIQIVQTLCFSRLKTPL